MNLNQKEIQCVNDIIDVIVNSKPEPNCGWHVGDGVLTILIDDTIKRSFPREEERKPVVKKMYRLFVYPYED